MKKILLVIFCILFCLPITVRAQERQEVYIVNIKFDSGQVKFGEVYTKSGYVPAGETEFDEFSYWLRIISFTGEVLDNRMFSVNPRRMYAPLEEGEEYEGPSGEVVESQLETAVILPYFKNGKSIELLSANRSVIEIKDIAYLSDVCDDGECQAHESAETCLPDCPVDGADNYCNIEQPKLDPDCQKFIKNSQENEASSSLPEVSIQEKKPLIKYLVIVILLLMIMLGSYGVYRYFQSKNNNQQL